MRFLLLLAILAAIFGGKAGEKAGKATTKTRRMAGSAAPEQAPRRPAAQSDQWAAARKKQTDAEHVHAAASDSCEARLENLKILHEAGILDDMEYSQRVARVKRDHAAR